MKKELLLFVLMSGSWVIAMETPKEQLSQEEQSTLIGLIHAENCPSTPKRTRHPAVPPNIKKQHRDRHRDRKIIKLSREEITSLRKALFS